MGKREELRTLQTRDFEIAKRRYAVALAEVEAKWAGLRAGPKALTEREAHELAASVHDHWLNMHRDNPSQQTFWPLGIMDRLWPSLEWDFDTPLSDRILSLVDPQARELESWCLRNADCCLAARGLIVDASNRLTLARAIAAAIQRASDALALAAKGQPFTVPDPSPSKLQNSKPDTSSPLRWDMLVDGWAAEKRPAEKTVYEWRRVTRKLSTFVGLDDARRLAVDDLIRWKAAMIEIGLRPKTIRDAQIAPIRALLRWGVDNRHLEANPANRIVIDVRVRPGEGRRSFNDDEAATVLRAAAEARDPVRRWVPWIGAYTGARISEVCQLRREDVIQSSTIWCIKFDPEAGTLKNANSERMVPIHPALVDSGFLGLWRL